MKLRLLTVFLIGLLITGCSGNESDNNFLDLSENTSQKYTQETEDKEITSDEEVASEENNSSQEPYVLNFTARTIKGDELTSDIFSYSKLTMINVWATYCNPCLSEMPDLGEIANSYDAKDFQMIGIISDVAEAADDIQINNASDLIGQTRADYPHLLLNESLYSNLVGAVDSVPTTFFVNQKGEVLGYVIGANSKEFWEDTINELLAQMQ